MCLSKRGFFLQAVDITGRTKVATYIANTICEVIKKVGSENVVQVVIDNEQYAKVRNGS